MIYKLITNIVYIPEDFSVSDAGSETCEELGRAVEVCGLTSDKGKVTHMYVCAYLSLCIHIYIYIYLYMYIDI